MRLFRGALGLLGVLVVAGAVVVASDPSLELAEPAIEALGNDYFVTVVPAALAILLVLLGLLVRGVTGLRQATPPDPEGVPTVPTFGADVDAFVTGRPGVRAHVLEDTPARMHTRLREAAIRSEMLATGSTREAATAVVDAGSWTDDPTAAAFCRPDGVSAGSLGSRLRAALRGRSWSQYGAAHAADALVSRTAPSGVAVGDGGADRTDTTATPSR